MKDMEKKYKKHNSDKINDIYKLFNITDDKKLLFNKMEKEWSTIPKVQEIKPYDIQIVRFHL